MSFITQLATTLVLGYIGYTLWRILKPYLGLGPLSHIPGPPRASWWMGNFGQIYNKDGWAFHDEIREKYGGAFKVNGLFGEELLYVSDSRALRHVAVQHPNVYEAVQEFLVLNSLAFGPGLASALGPAHRKQRKMLTPVFSTRHLRELVGILHPITHKLCHRLKLEIRNKGNEIDMNYWLFRAALECIGQGSMGYSFQTLEDEEKNNEFAVAMKKFLPTLLELGVHIQLGLPLTRVGPAWFRRYMLDFIPSDPLQRMKNIINVMDSHSTQILRDKQHDLEKGEETVLNQVAKGKDIMSILLRANLEAGGEERLSEAELRGEITTFVFAGTDTTSTALSRALWVLSLHPEAQKKLHDEIYAARRSTGEVCDLDYESLMALPYLDAVVKETMRVYPPASTINRIARQDMIMPLEHPIPAEITAGGESIDGIHVPANTRIIVGIYAANRSKEIWGPDADEWKPDRWLEDGKESKERTGGATEQLPGSYSGMMTFHGGQRGCIGFKLAELEIKLILAALFEEFKMAPAQEVEWCMASVQSPFVKGSGDDIPRLPLKVSLAT